MPAFGRHVGVGQRAHATDHLRERHQVRRPCVRHHARRCRVRPRERWDCRVQGVEHFTETEPERQDAVRRRDPAPGREAGLQRTEQREGAVGGAVGSCEPNAPHERPQVKQTELRQRRARERQRLRAQLACRLQVSHWCDNWRQRWELRRPPAVTGVIAHQKGVRREQPDCEHAQTGRGQNDGRTVFAQHVEEHEGPQRRRLALLPGRRRWSGHFPRLGWGDVGSVGSDTHLVQAAGGEEGAEQCCQEGFMYGRQRRPHHPWERVARGSDGRLSRRAYSALIVVINRPAIYLVRR